MEPAKFPLPETLGDGRYTVADRLGRGAHTEIVRAWDAQEGRTVALKLLSPAAAGSKMFRARFRREIKLLQELEHDNIVPIFDVHSDEFEYFTMWHASGGDVAAWLRHNGAVACAEALGVTGLVLRGLQYSHNRGVIHRDIKPTNVLVGGGLHDIRLTDYGIAREEEDGGANLTLAGDALGTVAYMAPEQCADPRDVSAASDLYSVGAMLYLLLTGRSPIDLASWDSDPEVSARLPGVTREIVRNATHPDPRARYQGAGVFMASLASAFHSLTPEEQAQKPRIRALADLNASTTVMYSGPVEDDMMEAFFEDEGSEDLDDDEYEDDEDDDESFVLE